MFIGNIGYFVRKFDEDIDREIFANNMHNNKGMYFMDIDCGLDTTKEYFENVYYEKEDRIYMGNSTHDIEHGCYITGLDEHLWDIKDTTLIYGNLQDEAYFIQYRELIKDWLRVLPEVQAFHFDLAGDYTAIKNAHYLILSNSTFAFFPAFTSETVKYIIAPKYWARYNVSDGYWASEQNIYSDFMYLDRKGRLFTAQECREELENYKKESVKYQRIGKKLTGISLVTARALSKWRIYSSLFERGIRSLRRRLAYK